MDGIAYLLDEDAKIKNDRKRTQVMVQSHYSIQQYQKLRRFQQGNQVPVKVSVTDTRISDSASY